MLIKVNLLQGHLTNIFRICSNHVHFQGMEGKIIDHAEALRLRDAGQAAYVTTLQYMCMYVDGLRDRDPRWVCDACKIMCDAAIFSIRGSSLLHDSSTICV